MSDDRNQVAVLSTVRDEALGAVIVAAHGDFAPALGLCMGVGRESGPVYARSKVLQRLVGLESQRLLVLFS